MNWKIFRVAALVGVAVVVLIALLFIQKQLRHKLVVKAYFTNAIGLRAGAPVRLAGVDIGFVRRVRARPETKEAPVEVVIVLTPGYDLNIPNDATASLATAGVLGQTYVSIDAASATGPPLEANGVLKATPTVELTTQQMLEKFGEIMTKQSNCDSKRSSTADRATAKMLSKKLSRR